jgi:hypothetical protein
VARGLSTDELEAIRDGLAAGRKPRVQFLESAGGQLAGQIGQVVSLTDPTVADEFVVVRFGRDELPFSPADLKVAPRGAPARKAPPAPAEPPADPAPPAPEFVIDKPPAPKPVAAPPAPRESGDDVQADPPAPRKAASRQAKPKSSPALTVTLAYGEGEWTVAAAQGAKVLAKPYVIRPNEALRMVSLVDVPGVQEAVEHILSAERAEAEQQAQRLRAELAEVEARLAELGETG